LPNKQCPNTGGEQAWQRENEQGLEQIVLIGRVRELHQYLQDQTDHGQHEHQG